MKFVIATGNSHKVEEFSRMLKRLSEQSDSPRDLCAVSAKELSIDMEGAVENGQTFEQNALIKAKYACKQSGLAAFADDSGLCVDALCGRPGIYSARYADTDDERISKLLCELDGVKEPDRGAKFVSAIACVFPDGRQFTVRGETFGRIAFEKEGDGGFGYDPVFLYEGKSFGKMTGEQKDAVSHRGKALDKCLAELKNYLGQNPATPPQTTPKN